MPFDISLRAFSHILRESLIKVEMISGDAWGKLRNPIINFNGKHILITIYFPQSFDYTELCQPIGLDNGAIPVSVQGLQRGNVSVHGGQNSPTTSISSNPASNRSSRPWHDFGRQNDADKIQIPKMWVYDLYLSIWKIFFLQKASWRHWKLMAN